MCSESMLCVVDPCNMYVNSGAILIGGSVLCLVMHILCWVHFLCTTHNDMYVHQLPSDYVQVPLHIHTCCMYIYVNVSFIGYA